MTIKLELTEEQMVKVLFALNIAERDASYYDKERAAIYNKLQKEFEEIRRYQLIKAIEKEADEQ